MNLDAAATSLDAAAPSAPRDPAQAARRAVETVCRMERARLVAGLVRLVRDIDAAEDLAQEAMLAAIAEWPRTGTPRSPAAWLTTTARRRAIDLIRHGRMVGRRQAELHHEQTAPSEHPASRLDAALDDPTGDDLLNLMFIACHPLLSRQQRTTLTLRLVAGLEAAEIARAFLTREATIAQRLVRAKRTLRASRFSLDPPRGAALTARLGSVLEVIYVIFNEGYAATSGERVVRPQLSMEARRLGRVLVGLAPQEPEALGLLALMELHSAREGARVGPGGLPIPLPQQDRGRWDRARIHLGLAALDRAQALPGPPGRYVLQALIAACHTQAPTYAETPWRRIAELYDALAETAGSPVVELNRAIAHGMASGPSAGLRLLGPLIDQAPLQRYGPLWAARGDLLFRAGAWGAAQADFTRAAALAGNEPERRFLLARARSCGPPGPAT